jgi:MYXO-CTERM domain-containing protein
MGPPPPPPDGAVPPPQNGSVDVVSRASPAYGAQGDQVNLWIVGREFVPGAQVAFSSPGIGPALVDGQPIPPEVVRRAESEQGKSDGLQYFARIAPNAATGPVDVTITNPDGSSATGAALFQIIEPGQAPPVRPGDGDVQTVTGASPRAMRAGRNVSLWIWGKGFETGARVDYSNASLRPYAEPSVVEVSQSHPGFAGIRSFLTVDGTALPGPVDVTVTNPNGTRATGQGIITIVEAAGTPGDPGGGGAVEYTGPCPDEATSIEAVLSVDPPTVARGDTVNLAISGRAFACGASIVIPGGGLRQVDTPRLVRQAADPLQTTLFWQIEVAEDATLGPRDVTVVNPNNTSKTLTAAFEVVEAERERPTGVAFCQARPGDGGSPAAVLLLAVPALLVRRRRRG